MRSRSSAKNSGETHGSADTDPVPTSGYLAAHCWLVMVVFIGCLQRVAIQVQPARQRREFAQYPKKAGSAPDCFRAGERDFKGVEKIRGPTGRSKARGRAA